MAITKRNAAATQNQTNDFDLQSLIINASSKSKTIEAIGETTDTRGNTYVVFEDEKGQQGAIALNLITWMITDGGVTSEGNTLSHEIGFKLNKKNNLFVIANVQEKIEL